MKLQIKTLETKIKISCRYLCDVCVFRQQQQIYTDPKKVRHVLFSYQSCFKLLMETLVLLQNNLIFSVSLEK